MCCPKCYTNYREDNSRETVNSLLRYKVPYPERSNCDQCTTDICATCFLPCKLAEAAGLIVCGIILCPIPCTYCHVRTKYYGTNGEMVTCGPRAKCQFPNPIRYTEHNINTNETTTKYMTGFGWCGDIYHGDINSVIEIDSTVNGFQCINGGIGKALLAVRSVVNLPWDLAALICTC